MATEHKQLARIAHLLRLLFPLVTACDWARESEGCQTRSAIIRCCVIYANSFPSSPHVSPNRRLVLPNSTIEFALVCPNGQAAHSYTGAHNVLTSASFANSARPCLLCARDNELEPASEECLSSPFRWRQASSSGGRTGSRRRLLSLARALACSVGGRKRTRACCPMRWRAGEPQMTSGERIMSSSGTND